MWDSLIVCVGVCVLLRLDKSLATSLTGPRSLPHPGSPRWWGINWHLQTEEVEGYIWGLSKAGPTREDGLVSSLCIMT